MKPSWAPSWGPEPLPVLLAAQLESHGWEIGDAVEIAAGIQSIATPQVRAALFADLGACKFLEGDIDGATSAWRHSIASGRDDDSTCLALLNLGLLFEHLHLYPEAAAALTSASELAIEPLAGLAALALARCQHAYGDGDAAMETLAHSIVDTMDGRAREIRGEALYGLGDIAEASGRYDRAERSWQAAMAEGSSRRGDAVSRLVRLLHRLGRHDEAAELVGELDPSDVYAQLEQAELLADAGDSGAAAAVALAVEGGSLDVLDRFRLADLRGRVGLANEAIDELEVLLANPDEAIAGRAGCALGALYVTHDMADTAALMFEGVSSGGDPYWSSKAALSLGDVHARGGQFGEATTAWRQAASSEISAISATAEARLSGAAIDTPRTRSQPDSAHGAASAEDHVGPGETAPTTSARASSGSVRARPGPFERALAQDPTESTSVGSAQPRAGAHDREIAERRERVKARRRSAAERAEAERAEAERAEAERAEAERAELGIATAPSEEPEVVVLSSLHHDDADAGDHADSDSGPGRWPLGGSLTGPGGGNDVTEMANPYVSLAPKHAIDQSATTANPYAELAPNYDPNLASPPRTAEPGDWESILDEWLPTDESQPPKSSSDGPRTFSRYT